MSNADLILKLVEMLIESEKKQKQADIQDDQANGQYIANKTRQ